MTVHAFVDESVRKGTYVMCAAIVDPAQLKSVRHELRGLLLRGQRELHFNDEKPARRRQIATCITRLTVSTNVYTARCTRKSEEAARQRCLYRLVKDLLTVRAQRLVIDTRLHRDTGDRATNYRALNARPSRTNLTYEHLDSASEALLWVPDAVAWSFGRRGETWRRLRPIIESVVDVDA